MEFEYNFDDYTFDNNKTVPCRIRNTIHIGQYFGNIHVMGEKWAIVLMSGCIKPEIKSVKEIEILKLTWDEINESS